MTSANDPAVIRRLLSTPGRWAVVGLSGNRNRAAYNVAQYLQRILGMEIVPVHPRAEMVHGAAGYRTLTEAPGPIDVVDLFVSSAHAGAIVDEAIAVGAKAIWFQLDVVDRAAAERARAAGLTVVLDACPSMEGSRLGLG